MSILWSRVKKLHWCEVRSGRNAHTISDLDYDKEASRREKRALRCCSHIFYVARVMSHIFSPPKRFLINVSFPSSALSCVSDLSFIYFYYIPGGWFFAGPSPVYQHHHHSRPYAHIPSSPYDRIGIRSHRPSPYPNPYHKRADLPTQGDNIFIS